MYMVGVFSPAHSPGKMAGVLNNAHQQAIAFKLSASPAVIIIMSTKRVRFGAHSAKSLSTRGGGSKSGTKATKKAKAKKKPEWDVRHCTKIQK